MIEYFIFPQTNSLWEFFYWSGPFLRQIISYLSLTYEIEVVCKILKTTYNKDINKMEQKNKQINK